MQLLCGHLSSQAKMSNTNLYIFGDSYGAPWPDHFQSWPNMLASTLSANQLNFALPGGSLYWMYKTFHDQIVHIKENDYVIVVLTNFIRKWFFYDRPKFSSIPAIEHAYDNKFLTKEEKNAIYNFYQYLDVPANDHAILILFLHLLQLLKEKHKINLLIIPNYKEITDKIDNYIDRFPLLNTFTGNLLTVHFSEYEKSFIDNIDLIDDRKPNHLTKSNHKIMLEKVLEGFETNHIDLTTGFKTDIINQFNYNEPEFMKAEMIENDPMTFKWRKK